ncbi:MAG: DMT family transporter [Planctomycetota bacterium]
MSTQQWVFIGLAVLTGMVIPLQPGMNAEMARQTGSPFVASLLSFCGGVLVLFAVVVGQRAVSGEGVQGVLGGLGSAPWWSYLGGLVGAVFVTVSVVLAPRLGAAVLVAGIVTGQLIGSLIVDHAGLVGFARQPVTWPRAIGACLLICGVVVMQLARE